MRFEYIKTTSGDVRQFSDQAKEIGIFNLATEAHAAKILYPIQSPKLSPPAPSASNRVDYSRPRFNYNEYMKSLKNKLELAAPTTNNNLSGPQF